MSEERLVNEKQSSISVSRTSKGAYSWDIKLYFNESEEETPFEEKPGVWVMYTQADKIIKELKRLDALMQTQFKEESK